MLPESIQQTVIAALEARGDRESQYALRYIKTMPVERLSERELEIAGMVGQGLTDAEIAERLVLSTRTVRTHIERVRDKLYLPNRLKLALWALKQGLATLDD